MNSDWTLSAPAYPNPVKPYIGQIRVLPQSGLTDSFGLDVNKELHNHITSERCKS